MFLLNGKKINIDAPMILGEGEGAIQYPAGWFRDAVARVAAGITEVLDPVRPDERFNFITENDDGSLSVTPKDLTPLKQTYKDQIDQTCGSARASAVSAGEYISEEYRRAYDESVAYKTAGYTGTAPISVQSWKDVSGMTNKAAADDIIATRDGYMALLDAIRAVRLSGKAAVDVATTPADVLAAVDTVNAALAALP